MKPKTDTWTIVATGAWNTRVFAPEWVGKHLLPGPLVVEVGLTAPVRLKFVSGDMIVVPADDRLIVGVQAATVQAMIQAEGVMFKALELLPHTPTTGLGVNFGFEEANPDASLISLFTFPDQDKLSKFGCTISSQDLRRKLEIEGTILNSTLSLSEGKVSIHLNFHQEGPFTVARQSAETCFNLAQKFLSSVYNEHIEEVES